MRTRHLVPELMDDPGLSEGLHLQALSGLNRINKLCRTASVISRTIVRIVGNDRGRESSAQSSRPLRVLDIGSGGGDVTAGVFKYLQSHGVSCDVTGWDMSSLAVETATRRFGTHKFGSKSPNGSLAFSQKDVIQGLQENKTEFDIIFCSLFLHHLTDEQAATLLQLAKQNAKKAIIVDDLVRSRLGYWLACLGCRLLSRSAIVHFDGPQSVKAAFRCDEVRGLADQSGLDNVKIVRRWPRRYTLIWKNEQQQTLPVETSELRGTE